MSIWLVIPTNRINAFKAVYLAKNIRGSGDLDQSEKLGAGVKNADDSKRFFGSSRMTAQQATELGIVNAPWLEIHTTSDFIFSWDYPLP